jgi:cytochrome c peroxidase
MIALRGKLCAATIALLVSASAVLSAEPATPIDMAALKAKYRRPAEIPFPADNPYTPEKAALGKSLFFDPRLSGSQNMTCASCHNPSFGWEVPLKGAVGAMNTVLARNAPTVINQAWSSGHYFWDGRAPTLEEQAKGPIETDVEMNLPLDEAVRRLKSISEYDRWFKRIFPAQGITGDNITRALATFERTVVSSYAPFDAWIDGNEAAISNEAKRGFALFNGKANCAACHVGWNFTDGKFHDIGIDTTDLGRGKIEPGASKAKYAFKTPSLRDITQRAPYMHDGSLANLDAVMAHFVAGGLDRPSISPQMRKIDLSAQEVADVIAFLTTLTGTSQIVSLPVLPN